MVVFIGSVNSGIPNQVHSEIEAINRMKSTPPAKTPMIESILLRLLVNPILVYLLKKNHNSTAMNKASIRIAK
jgi:hypothetical protein